MTPIYHITHFQNIPSIIDQDGLWSDRLVTTYNIGLSGIAHKHIKHRRERRQVPLSFGGTLYDYVPFYFAPRSPMLFAIHKGAVVGYNEGQRAIVYLVSTVEIVAKHSLSFVFTDGHADVNLSQYFDDLADLEKIDWDVMNATYWSDTSMDSDRKRRRQAEFLVHQFFPWSLITEIGVQTPKMAHTVHTFLQKTKHQPKVIVKPTWYY